MEGTRVAGCRLKEFDEEHAVVHRATEGAKKAWLGFRQVMVVVVVVVKSLRPQIHAKRALMPVDFRMH